MHAKSVKCGSTRRLHLTRSVHSPDDPFQSRYDRLPPTLPPPSVEVRNVFKPVTSDNQMEGIVRIQSVIDTF